jgi:hypothetical protein
VTIAKAKDGSRLPLLEAEQDILERFIDNWDIENTTGKA